jgi:putative transferase (TIGR04331 family)
MIKEINSAKLIIQTYCGTGHLETLAINKPMLILFVHNLNLLNDKSKNYFKKFIKLGIVHTTPESLLKMLENLDNISVEKWWNSKKRKNLLKKYREDFGFFNREKIKDLTNIIVNT